MLALSRNEAIPYEVMKLAMKWDWETFPQYLDSLDRLPKGINLLTHVPLSPVYARVMGYDEAKVRRPTTAELQRMCQLVDEGIEAGACGWSTQIMGANSFQRDYDGTPLITDLMTQEEAFTFAKVVANRISATSR